MLTQIFEHSHLSFLDPFIESNNASLVTLEFFQKLRKCLKSDGILVASTALHVKIPYRDSYGIYSDKHIETLHQKSSQSILL